MSFIKAKEYIEKYGLEKNIMEFTVSSATVEEAARAVNCKEEEIAKTLSFLVEEKPIVIVVAGDKKIDNSKYKAEFHSKAKMNVMFKYFYLIRFKGFILFILLVEVRIVRSS